MKYLVLSLLLSVQAFAQSDNEISKNLTNRALHFDSAFDLTPNSDMAIFSKTERLYARVSCNQNPASGFKAYLALQVYSRFGSALSMGWLYLDSYGACQEMKLDIFDNPQNYEFKFGPVNRWDNREMTVTVLPK